MREEHTGSDFKSLTRHLWALSDHLKSLSYIMPRTNEDSRTPKRRCLLFEDWAKPRNASLHFYSAAGKNICTQLPR